MRLSLPILILALGAVRIPGAAAGPQPAPASTDSAAMPWRIPLRLPAAPPAPAETRASPESASAVDFLWVVRTTLVHPEEFPDLIAQARTMGVRGLLVQVVGRGDAYYPSALLPRAEALGPPRTDGAEPDRLADLIARAHAAGLEVHAWMNCLLAWSAPQRPRDPSHVVNAHPEWIARMRDGRKLSQLSPRQRARLKVEGVFLAPANAGVRTFIASIAAEIARRYPVDGIHLDYIRQPGVAVGYDPGTRAQFALETGVDPLRLGAVPEERRAEIDSLWADFQRRQVTAVVREVRDSLAAVDSALARRPALSAAVLADTAAARDLHAQAWPEWLRTGCLDRAYVMCYAAPVQTVLDQLAGYERCLGTGRDVVPGIAVYNTRPALAAAKIQGARALGFPLLALYSYDALKERPGYWQALQTSLAAPEGGR